MRIGHLRGSIQALERMKHMANVRIGLLILIPAVTSKTYLTLGMLL